ncbi:MAG: UDP-N-acetylmuramoyl-L-alanine--D-glutamate ligase, partial [Actinomycetota bacterium]|nr:UDP-N-acetylmuramoyl-L-alanine--D-glutamate ligase [Actinomycetota bacterium]
MDTLPRRIAVLGMGASGLAVARYLLDHRDRGHELVLSVYDAGVSALLGDSAALLGARGACVHLGADRVDPADLCIASPGIPPSSLLRRSAAENCARIISEIEFAYARSSSPWLAITGTNGKTTVTSLVAHVLGAGAVPAECVGNIGDPAIEVVDSAGPSTAIVAEVSSFQLALTERFHPRVSVLLNITPDHIDWHGSLEAYASDKARVFRNQGVGDTAIICVDDAGAAPYAESVAAQGVRVVRVSRETLHPGGAGMLKGVLTLDTPSGPVQLLSASELRIKGGHNVTNALAAAAAAAAWGVAPATITRALADFEPIAHRLQPVGVVGEVEYVNDSKATNPGAVLVALKAFP